MSKETHAALLEAAKDFDLSFEDTSEPAEGYITANGLKLHYLDWGSSDVDKGGSDTPILFLHGGNQTAHTWDLVCLQLRREFRCLALDQRGHGESEAGAERSISPFVQREDVREAIEALGLDRLVLIGMSMGGLNTLAYSGEYGVDRLSAVTIVDVGPTLRKEGFRDTGKFLREKRTFASIDEAAEYASGFITGRPISHLKHSLMHSLKQQPDGTYTWRYAGPDDESGRKVSDEEVLATYEKLWDEVPKITCPTLVVHGEVSSVFTREAAEKLAKTLPQGRVVTIPGAGHTVQGDQPKAFADAVRGFLREVLPA